MQKRLDRMEKVERPKKEGPGMRVALGQGERSERCPSSGRRVKAFRGKATFRNPTMDVRYKEHVALLGRNGCGKTTLSGWFWEKYLRMKESLNWEAA